MGIGVAGVIGGTLTLVGSVPQVIANGIIMSAGYDSLGFFDFAKVSGPCIIVALIYFLTVGFSIQKKVLDFDDVSPVSQEYLEQNKGDENSGKLTRPMILSACVFIFCAICFITGQFPIAVTALIGAAVLFATKAMDFKTTMRNLDWNALIVVAASTSFATGLNASGGGELIAETVLGFFGGENASVTVLLIVGVIISAILGQVMSMTAIVSMMVPIYISISESLGVSPYPFVYALILAASTGLATPVGNAGITQTMVGGYRFKDYVKIEGLSLS